MIFVRLSLLVCFLSIATNVVADKTNINEVTDLFDRSVSNKDQYVRDLERIREGGISNIESSTPLVHIDGIDQSEGEAARLNSIRAVDLDEEGRVTRRSGEYSFYDEGEFEPDLTKPGNRAHKEDVLRIVNATVKLLSDLTAKLKELGVDCKTVKGPIQREPIYTIDLKREEQQNTEYDQFFCEEPRNQYDCSDSLSLTCARRGFIKTEKTKIYIPAAELEHLFHPDEWGRSTFWEMHLATGIIAAKIGASADSIVMEEKQIIRWAKRNGKFYNRFIGYTIDDNGQLGTGNHGDTYKGYNHFAEGFDPSYGFHAPTWCGNETWHHNTVIRLWYSLSEEICEEWSEDWDERCHLK